MPADLRALYSDRQTLKVPVNGKPMAQCGPDDVVTLTYRPSAVNLESELKARQMREAGDAAVYRLASSLRDTLLAWDVVQPKLKRDADGQPVLGPDGQSVHELDGAGQPLTEPVPLTVEVLGSLGIKRLNEWHRAISEDLFPDPTTGTSSATSQPTSPETGS